MPVLARTAHTIEDNGRFASLRSLVHHRDPRRSQIDIAMKTSPIDQFFCLLACNLPFLQPAVAQAVAAVPVQAVMIFWGAPAEHVLDTL
jgi:hypothetical protein